jgi:pyruvate dehydrogenase E1 component alpha subunit
LRKEEGLLGSQHLLEVFRTALTARRFEERVVRLARAGEVPATLHVGAGHEVCQAAALAALRPTDPLLYGHRGTAYWIARGLDLGVILCDIAGLDGGTNDGRGGVMHVVDTSRAILGESGTLGGNFVIGAGVAYADRALGTDNVTIVFFGDGTSNRGQFHEAANFAAVDRLPLILFCENNGWGLSVPTSRSTSVPDIASRAAAYGMPGIVVDGNDAATVYAAVSEAARRARAGEGPTLIEAKVTRIAGHWLGDRETYRPQSDAPDPLPQLEEQLRKGRVLTAKKLEALQSEIDAQIDAAVEYMRAHHPAELASAT